MKGLLLTAREFVSPELFNMCCGAITNEVALPMILINEQLKLDVYIAPDSFFPES